MKLAAAGMLLVFASNLHAQHRRPAVAEGRVSEAVPVVDLPSLTGAFPPTPNLVKSSQPLNPVSVNELLIPPKAAKEFNRSEKALQTGDLRASVAHLEKAVQIYPQYLLAHNALGMHCIKLGEYQKALGAFQSALAIDPLSAQTYQNLSLAFFFLHDYASSETAARRSLELAPQQIPPRYLLGRALIAQQHFTPEATQMLLQSEDLFPNASLVLAHIQLSQDNTQQVVAELRHYLKAPVEEDNRQKAECWLANLTNSIAPVSCSGIKIPPNFQ